MSAISPPTGGSDPIDEDDDDDDDSQVILSVDVFSVVGIAELDDYSVGSTVDGENRYRIGRAIFDEPDWRVRADRLESELNGFLDRLASVPRDLLHTEGTFVRFFLTLPHGAETIPAEIVRRLADVNATIWIDA